jgi:DNA-binding NarL/FixJ family response regulator
MVEGRKLRCSLKYDPIRLFNCPGFGVTLHKNIPMAISVGIVEDHSEFRQSLVYLISSFSEYSVDWAYPSVEEALEKYIETDVMLLDISLPGLTGLEAIPLFKQKCPGQKIIMLTILDDDYHILESIKKGADGYILKKSSPGKILDAIQQVHEGGAALTPMVARQVMAYLKPDAAKPESPSNLTTREKEILLLITQGMTNEAMAEVLFISVQTVRNHIKNIYDKLQVHSRAQVVVKAFKDKLI